MIPDDLGFNLGLMFISAVDMSKKEYYMSTYNSVVTKYTRCTGKSLVIPPKLKTGISGHLQKGVVI